MQQSAIGKSLPPHFDALIHSQFIFEITATV